MGTELIWAKSYWKQFLIEATETLLRFQCLLNLDEVLGKIWAEVVALTVRNHTKIEIGFRSSEVWDVKFIKSILTIVKKMKGFSDKKIIFLIDVVLEKWRTVLSIKLGIQNMVNIPSLITILSNNGLSRFLLLIRQGISGYVA